MELRHLRYYIAVAEELNFRKAAERLHISTPPLFTQIRDLEQEIGASLLTREGRVMQLTKAGSVFLAEARETLARARRGVALTRQVAAGYAGSLAIGYNTVAAFGVFPQIVRAFNEQWPNVRLTCHYHSTPRQLNALSRDDLEIGFLCPPVPTDEFEVHELSRQPFVAIVPDSHPLAHTPQVSFEALSREPLITYSRALDPHAFSQIQQNFERANAVMNVVHEFESVPAIVQLVALGGGCCIVPEYVRALCPRGVVCKSLDPAGIHCSMAIVKKRCRAGNAGVFYRFVLDSFSEPAQP